MSGCNCSPRDAETASSPAGLRLISTPSWTADVRGDSFSICNGCGRRWRSWTIGGYPQDEEDVFEDVTGRTEYDPFFVMDVTTALSLAAQEGDHERVAKLVEAGADLEERSHLWPLEPASERILPLIAEATPLMAAVYFGREDCVRLLLDRGADPNAKSADQQTPLNIAARLGSDSGFSSWAPTLNVPVPPQLAVELPEGADLRIVRALLDKHANPYADRSRALLIAAGRRYPALARLLTSSDVLPKGEGQDALLEAAQKGDKETIEVLLQRGADVNGRGLASESLLMAAVRDTWVMGEPGTPLRRVSDRRKDMAEFLLAKGADVAHRDGNGETALLVAARGKDAAEVVALLIERGADVHALNKDGETALHKAAWASCAETIEVLLGAGADPTAKDTRSYTAADVAERNGGRLAPKLVELLEARTGKDIAGTEAAVSPRVIAGSAAGPPLASLLPAAMNGDDLSTAVPRLKALIARAEKRPDDDFIAYEGRQAFAILACHFFFHDEDEQLRTLLAGEERLVRPAVAETINRGGGLWDIVSPWEKSGDKARRRKAAAVLAYLLTFDERPERIEHLIESPSPDVVNGALQGLLKAARAGRDLERYLRQVRKLRRRKAAAEIVTIVEAATSARPAPTTSPTKNPWSRGDDHCEVNDNEVVCWSGEGRNSIGSGCGLEQFRDGDPLWDIIVSLLGRDVLEEVKAEVRDRLAKNKARDRLLAETQARDRLARDRLAKSLARHRPAKKKARDR
jgi:ankyrin repeat protein